MFPFVSYIMSLWRNGVRGAQPQCGCVAPNLSSHSLVTTPPATYGPGGIFGKKKELLEAPFSLGVFYTV